MVVEGASGKVTDFLYDAAEERSRRLVQRAKEAQEAKIVRDNKGMEFERPKLTED